MASKKQRARTMARRKEAAKVAKAKPATKQAFLNVLRMRVRYLNAHTVDQLRAVAKRRGNIANYSRKNKIELISILSMSPPPKTNN